MSVSLDISECQSGLHNCSQKCVELEGGFSCACNEGYELDSDQISCKGTMNANGQMMKLK